MNTNVSFKQVLKTLTVQAAEDLVRGSKAVAQVTVAGAATGSIVAMDKTGAAAQGLTEQCQKGTKFMADWVTKNYASRVPQAVKVDTVVKNGQFEFVLSV